MTLGPWPLTLTHIQPIPIPIPIPHDGTAEPPTSSITRFDPALTRRADPIRPLLRWTLDDRPVTCCWPLNGSDRTRRPAWDGPPTSDLRCCRLASHPHADRRHDHQAVRQSPTIPCMHAHTANAPRKSAAHTPSIHLILDTYNPLAIVPALPSSRLPRHVPHTTSSF